MNAAADEMDRILNSRRTMADWCDRVCYALIGGSTLYLLAHLAAWAWRGFSV